jgi:hypothetical protein
MKKKILLIPLFFLFCTEDLDISGTWNKTEDVKYPMEHNNIIVVREFNQTTKLTFGGSLLTAQFINNSHDKDTTINLPCVTSDDELIVFEYSATDTTEYIYSLSNNRSKSLFITKKSSEQFMVKHYYFLMLLDGTYSK